MSTTGVLIFFFSVLGLGITIYLHKTVRINMRQLIFWFSFWMVLIASSFKIEIIAFDINIISNKWIQLSPSFLAILSVFSIILFIQVLNLHVKINKLSREITAINQALSLAIFKREIENKEEHRR